MPVLLGYLIGWISRVEYLLIRILFLLRPIEQDMERE